MYDAVVIRTKVWNTIANLFGSGAWVWATPANNKEHGMEWGIFEDDARRYLDSLIYQRQIDALAQNGDQTATAIVLVAREMSGEHIAPRRRKRKRQRQKPEKQKRFGSAALVGNDTKDLTMEKLLRAADLAEILGFAKRSIINMAREKPHLLPPYIRVSDSYRWRPSIVQAWMDDKSQEGPKEQEAAAKATEKPKRGRGRPRK